MLRIIKKIWIVSVLAVFIFPSAVQIYAADEWEIEVDWFNILPELEDETISDINEKIKEIWENAGRVMDNYRQAASGRNDDPWKQIQSWIMNWGTITNYITFVIKFLSQVWIAVWALFIMIAWYRYMISVFKWWQAPKSSSIINAIIWVIIVIFSYAIMRTLTSIIWLT